MTGEKIRTPMYEQSTSKGFAILSSANIIVKILAFLYLPFLLRILQGEGYGIYSAAYQVYVFIYVIANSGLPASISKLVSEFAAGKDYKNAVKVFKVSRSILIIVGLAMSIIMLVLAKPLVKVLHFEKSYMAIIALVPSIFLTSLTSAYRGYFQGRGFMTPSAISQVAEQFMNTTITLVFTYTLIKYGVEVACAGGAAATALAALFALIILIAYYRKSIRGAEVSKLEDANLPSIPWKQLAVKIISYGIPITFCAGVQFAGNLVDLGNTKVRLLAAGFTDARATELYGYLAKFQQLVNVPISIVSALTAVILPAIAGAVALKNKDLIKRKFDYAFRLSFLITIPSAVGMALLSTPIYEMMKFQPGSYLMQYGSIIIVLMSIQMLQVAILQGAGIFYIVAANAVLGILVKIAVNYILIAKPEININGALIGSISGYLVTITLNSICIIKYLKIKQSLFKMLSKPLVSSIIMTVPALIIYFGAGGLLGVSKKYIPNVALLFLTIIVCAFTYLYTSLLIGAITSEDLGILPSVVLRIIPGWIRRKI